MDINARFARHLFKLRTELGFPLELLAARSGVSRAMISHLERAGSSPTLAVMNKLAIGLGLPLFRTA